MYHAGRGGRRGDGGVTLMGEVCRERKTKLPLGLDTSSFIFSSSESIESGGGM